ncbi:hypothetical protein [Candidatus Synchoanobacter obligatus]|uniref:RimM N-terminal domain-containing protein n=1 Tax=Candidatus Synchoanobacter obligatus TaxID=2919597 RepID=A0ABT1L5T6_9GAMM|nr:hypothetical protein [Candidatus Synchoanobacter obligatus]MCP8352525.1 hypothetical protein [Candidatus Synchoanobacter obligatus]
MTFVPLHIATIGKAHGIKGLVSIISKTEPVETIFDIPLYIKRDHQFQTFDVTSFDIFHKKVVCKSPLIADRTEAERFNSVKIYCELEPFRAQYPEQIFSDLCHGYRIYNANSKLLGLLNNISIMQNLYMMVIQSDQQTLHLPLQIEHIDHHDKTIQLSYSPA